MARRLVLSAALALAAMIAAGGAHAAELKRARSINPASDALLRITPADRDAKLAGAVGHWCIGTETFLMGVVSAGPAAGNAYWSLRCLDGTSWAVQIDSLGEVTAIDCESFKENGGGKECFKKF